MSRYYIPIGMDRAQASEEFKAMDWEARSLASQISEMILDQGLTPLQAQAVLVQAWALVQTQGVLRVPDRRPSQT